MVLEQQSEKMKGFSIPDTIPEKDIDNYILIFVIILF
jgi:hypothetical protein